MGSSAFGIGWQNLLQKILVPIWFLSFITSNSRLLMEQKYAGIWAWKSSQFHKDTKTCRPNCRRRRLSESVLGCASIGGIIQILSVEILPQPSYTVNSGLWDWFCSNPSYSNSRDASLEKKTLLPNKTKDLEDFAWLKKNYTHFSRCTHVFDFFRQKYVWIEFFLSYPFSYLSCLCLVYYVLAWCL